MEETTNIITEAVQEINPEVVTDMVQETITPSHNSMPWKQVGLIAVVGSLITAGAIYATKKIKTWKAKKKTESFQDYDLNDVAEDIPEVEETDEDDSE